MCAFICNSLQLNNNGQCISGVHQFSSVSQQFNVCRFYFELQEDIQALEKSEQSESRNLTFITNMTVISVLELILHTTVKWSMGDQYRPVCRISQGALGVRMVVISLQNFEWYDEYFMLSILETGTDMSRVMFRNAY